MIRKCFDAIAETGECVNPEPILVRRQMRSSLQNFNKCKRWTLTLALKIPLVLSYFTSGSGSRASNFQALLVRLGRVHFQCKNQNQSANPLLTNQNDKTISKKTLIHVDQLNRIRF